MAHKTRILVLPGIGDIYWIAVALQALAKRYGWGIPVVSIWDFDGRRRSSEYVDRIPFVRNGGYYAKPPHPHRMPEFRQSYHTGEASIFPGLFGFDYYLAVNGALRQGRTIEDALGVECNWYFEHTQTPGERSHAARARATWGDYIVCHFSEFGMFKAWVKAWGIEGCAALLERVHDATGCTMLLTGCEWDRPFSEALARRCRRGVVCIAGETVPDMFFGLMRGARGVLGWCGGNTILATAWRIPTLIAWSRFFPDSRFFRNACPPDAIGKHYAAVITEAHTPALAAEMFLKVLERNTLPNEATA